MRIIKQVFKLIKIYCVYFIDKKKYKIEIYNTRETLETIIKDRKSIARFGDGEFSLVFGENLSFQKYSPKMAEKYKEMLLANPAATELCAIAIPYVYCSFKGYTINSIEYWGRYFEKNRRKVYGLLNPTYKYFDAQVTRIYINRHNKKESVEYFELWKELWRDKEVLLVEGEQSRFGVGNDLFAGVKSLERILCPASDAFDFYDEILETIIKNGKDKLVLLVLGPTATILAYDLAQLGYWAVDTGNLDMEYEWLKRGVKQKVAIKGKYTNEAKGGDIPYDYYDDRYNLQIIGRIGV